MTRNVPAPQRPRFNVGNLASAAGQIGSPGGGGDGRFLSVDHNTGAMTVGKEQQPFDLTVRYAVRIEELLYGFYVFEGSGTPDKSNMVPMISGRPKPVPPQGYTKYPLDGARDMAELKLHPLSGAEAGNPIEFAPTSVSSQNRIHNLVQKIVINNDLPAGEAGFCHPVIEVFPNSYVNSYGRIFHWDFKVVDWLDGSGQVLWSQWEGESETPDVDEVLGTDEVDLDDVLNG